MRALVVMASSRRSGGAGGKKRLSSHVFWGRDVSVDDLRRHVRGFFPDIEGWKEHVKTPVPWFDTAGVVYQVTGVDKSGKSFLTSLIASRYSKKGPVVFVTTERAHTLVASHLLDLGADLDNIVFLDYSDSPIGVLGRASIGKGVDPFQSTQFYRDAKSVYETLSGRPVLMVIDSLTGFFEAAEWSGRLLTSNLARTVFNLPGVIAFAISQKRTSHSEYNTEVAGGLTVSHILDGTFILAKHRFSVFKRYNRFIAELSKRYGGVVHTFRWDGNRWGPHPEHEFVLAFEDNDIRVDGPLSPDLVDAFYAYPGGV